MFESAGHGAFILRGRESIAGRDAEAFQALPHYGFEELPGSFTIERIGIEHGHGDGANGPGLQNGATVSQDVDHSIQLRPGHGERSALHGGDALLAAGVAEIQAGGDDDACRGIDLAEQIFIYQDTAVLRGEQIGAASSRQPDFQAAATGFDGYLTHGLVFADFSLFELRDPDLA
jgi:hypothetical protein